jgi:hypothetical protein
MDINMTMDANWVCHVIFITLLQTTCNKILGAYWANGGGINVHLHRIPYDQKFQSHNWTSWQKISKIFLDNLWNIMKNCVHVNHTALQLEFQNN